MALAEDVKEKAVPGVLIALGVAVLLPVLKPFLASVARPFAKGAVKGGLVVFEKGREKLAEAGELFEDLLAEARVELAEEQRAASGAAPAQGRAEEEPAEGPSQKEAEERGGESEEDVAKDIADEGVKELEKDLEDEVRDERATGKIHS